MRRFFAFRRRLRDRRRFGLLLRKLKRGFGFGRLIGIGRRRLVAHLRRVARAIPTVKPASVSATLFASPANDGTLTVATGFTWQATWAIASSERPGHAWP